MQPDRDRLFIDWTEAHRGIFFKIARAYAPEPADQADLVQGMLVQLWRTLANFRAQCQPSTWIYRVCLNTALTWRRDVHTRRERVIDGMDINLAVSPDPRPGHAQEELELLARLYAAIRELPQVERTLIVLSLDGLSYREMSEISGLTENHVGVGLNRARRKLSELMKEVHHEL
jgi:RNA polymerase sigma-70 factor (ECF subfamily)